MFPERDSLRSREINALYPKRGHIGWPSALRERRQFVDAICYLLGRRLLACCAATVNANSEKFER
jgi:hypothetical protein